MTHSFLSTDLLIYTNLKTPLQKDIETWVNVSLNFCEQRKIFQCEFWNHCTFQKIQMTIHITQKKDKYKYNSCLPHFLLPKYCLETLLTGMPWTLTVSILFGSILTKNKLGLGGIFANYPFSPVNFSYIFSNQNFTILLEPTSLPMHFQLNYICAWQWPAHPHYLAFVLVSPLQETVPFPQSPSLFILTLLGKVEWSAHMITRQNESYLCWNSTDSSFMILFTICIN